MTLERPRVVTKCCFLRFWLQNVLCATDCVHFLNSQTSKIAPKLRCFYHFDFEMCFVPQPRALFEQPNFQKRSQTEVFFTFWLRDVLRATRPQGHAISLIRPDGSVPPLERAYFSTLSRLFYLFAHFELLSSSSLSLLWLLLLLCLSLICLSSSLTLSLLTLSLLWLFSPLLLHRSSVHKSEVWLLNFLR